MMSFPRLRLARKFVASILAATGISVAGLSAAPLLLKVNGIRLLTVDNTGPRLRGVNCAGLEWSSTGDGRMLQTVRGAVQQWNSNIVRLPLSQDRWFGKGPEQKGDATSYRALVRQIVDFCASHDAYVILDLHWSDAGVWGTNIGAHNLPDKNSIEFWRDLAPVFKDNPAVLYELYNEAANVTWEQWFNGGRVTEIDPNTKATVAYEAVGMRALLDAIRATGARNLVVATVNNHGWDVSGILDGHQLSDPRGNGVIYGVKCYPRAVPESGRETIAQWTSRIESFARRFPIFVSEFGSMEEVWPLPKEWGCNDEKWNREIIGVFESHGWSWTAWDFHLTAWPPLILDLKFTPTSDFGVWVKQALAENER